ncbi:MAG: hypothetical protein P1U86_05700 [Verrucomicrobiales bacterium]|nr:hypothetical protein [Verrucomicrobiales bacterium]
MPESSENERFQPSDPAHALCVELATRISTQLLHYRSGDEETAASSLYSLFDKSRKLMAEHPKETRFHSAALVLLNDILRPYTARWHGWMTVDHEGLGSEGNLVARFRDEWVRRKFREELRELQPLLHGACKFFYSLSIGKSPTAAWLNPPKRSEAYDALRKECASAAPEVFLGESISLKIRPQVPLYGANGKGINISHQIASEIEQAEQEYIAKRREKMGFPSASVEDTIGLAFSGGGIRSATFCLGVAQSLHRHGIFNQVDFLSTVSGGGYLGTFLSSYLGTNHSEDSAATPPASDQSPLERVDEVLGHGAEDQAEPPPVRHLRNNSKYLLNGGGWAKVRIAGVLATGFFASLLMLLTIPLLAAWGAWGVKRLSAVDPFKAIALPDWNLRAIFEQPASPLLALLLVFFAISWVAKLFCQRLAEGKPWESAASKWQRLFESGFLGLGVASALVFALCASYLLVEAYESLTTWLVSFQIFPKIPEWLGGVLASILPIAFGALSKRKDGSSRKWAEVLFYFTGPLFFLFTFLIFASHLGVDGRDISNSTLVIWAIATTILLLWAFLCLNINTFAPHRYYRDRLCECYLAAPRKSQRTLIQRGLDNLFHGTSADCAEALSSVGVVKSIPLDSIGTSHAAPYHLINAVINAEAGKNPELRGRNGDFFLFSRHYCGCPLTGYITTEKMRAANPGIDLGTAMAISGAAASTNMGSKTLRRMRFLMTLFNVRLGYWMRRPGSDSWPALIDGPGPIYFIREMLGAVHERTRYINLSDGGHIENLATYELLRRQCKFIVCVDAGMEPGLECADLMRLQRLAEIDFGIRMHFDPTDLTLLPTQYSRAYGVLVKIDYAPEQATNGRETSNQLGWMLYLKLAVTGTEPRHILDYRRQNPEFPHQSTGDQLYDEAQFEAYRSLGECAASSLFRDEIIGHKRASSKLDVKEWFEHLARSLLADNDEAVTRSSES